jgi:hypothetical protein
VTENRNNAKPQFGLVEALSAVAEADMAKPGFSSLTGYWAGAYLYSRAPGAPAVAFNATIEDIAGQLLGEIDEPNTFADPAAPRLFADLVGTRSGHDVRFVKSMDGTGGARHDIVYSGTVTADFMRIVGEWRIPSDWSGHFWMERIDGAMAASEEAVDEKVR